MRVAVEILDHIFSFLAHDYSYSTLSSCSESDDPVLSPIADRYLYSRIAVYIGDGIASGTTLFKPDRLSQFLSVKPRVKDHVRSLRVINGIDVPPYDEAIRTFAEILVLFPNLECIDTFAKGRRWPDVFRASLKGPLDLSTVKEVRLIGEQTEFPYWLLDRCENLRNLFLLGTFEEDDQAPCDSTPAQLKALLLHISLQSYSLNWIKRRINQLESLTISSHVDPTAFPVLLEACSATLKEFDINLTGSRCYNLYSFQIQHSLVVKPLPVLSPLPPNLHRLTIRMAIKAIFDENSPEPEWYQSWLPAAAELIGQFIPHRPRHLVLNIEFKEIADITSIDISPLAILEAASVSSPRIDLYASTTGGILFTRPPIPMTDARLMSALEKYTEVAKLVNEGKIAIHAEKTAPFGPGINCI